MSGPPSRICAISGGSGAGKTTLALRLLDRLESAGTHLTIDWYYRDLSHLTARERAEVNFDHPDSLDVDTFVDDLCRLKSGSRVAAPVYDFSSHMRTAESRVVEPAPIIVTEGIHLLGLEAVRAQCDVMVFIDVSAEIRLDRRLRRDFVERGRSTESVLEQWHTTVAPMHDRFVQPSMAHADVVVGFDDRLDRVARQLAERLVAAGQQDGVAR
jgi:uridine kinase